ncbi:MAG: hypothetical protein ACTSVI_06945 [Promethearchaeota archaeon]
MHDTLNKISLFLRTTEKMFLKRYKQVTLYFHAIKKALKKIPFPTAFKDIFKFPIILENP